MYAGGVVRRLVDGLGSTGTSSSSTTDVTEYSLTGGVRRLVTPLSTPRSSPLAPHLPTTSGAAPTGLCRWTHHQQQQGYGGMLDDNVEEDFALMASFVSAAATSSSNCDDVLLKGP